MARWKTVAQEERPRCCRRRSRCSWPRAWATRWCCPTPRRSTFKRACAADSDLTSLWLADVGHITAGDDHRAGGRRLAGRPLRPADRPRRPATSRCRSPRPPPDTTSIDEGVGPRGRRSSRQTHGQRLEAPQHDVLLVGELRPSCARGCGARRNSAGNATCASRRASGAPRQWWMPKPKPRWLLSARRHVEDLGVIEGVGVAVGGPDEQHGELARRDVAPPTSMSSRATRPVSWTGHT